MLPAGPWNLAFQREARARQRRHDCGCNHRGRGGFGITRDRAGCSRGGVGFLAAAAPMPRFSRARSHGPAVTCEEARFARPGLWMTAELQRIIQIPIAARLVSSGPAMAAAAFLVAAAPMSRFSRARSHGPAVACEGARSARPGLWMTAELLTATASGFGRWRSRSSDHYHLRTRSPRRRISRRRGVSLTIFRSIRQRTVKGTWNSEVSQRMRRTPPEAPAGSTSMVKRSTGAATAVRRMGTRPRSLAGS